MKECPYCGSELRGAADFRHARKNTGVGRKSTGAELVSCPDCNRVIDGFAAH